ncbi:Lar family restriction alleviation protein [Parendozoicomonas sp. Alg238-R29]|uniref:Lar family restriction alleviation protein n=1 Tax=Parendozoicomonas sp. Alg238-R29 TaxID=2993446 RepID=UPI00248F232E|nr:Lar family restriction alleviation protein [Parendozoicomonas sp. Alg238-R29]
MRMLKRCPSCRGDAEIIEFPVSNDILWQINCQHCGLATELDDDRGMSIQHWNRRDQEERMRSLITILVVLFPAGMLIMFFLGLFFGGVLLGGEQQI